MCRGVASIAETKAFIQEVIEKMRERSSKEGEKGRGCTVTSTKHIFYNEA